MVKNPPTVVSIHAHPDDEVMLTGQFLAKAADRGLRTVVVYGSRGEAGETDMDLGEETLGERRSVEARAACTELGVDRVEFLRYIDSGMAGTAANEHPDAFGRSDPAIVAAEIAALLADEDVWAVVGYDANGTYGHPDHLQVHRVAHAVAPKLGAGWVLEATYNREYLASLPDSDGSLDPKFAEAEETLTHFVQGETWFRAKMEGIKKHESQVRRGERAKKRPQRNIDGWRTRFGTEWFVAQSLRDTSSLGALADVLEPKANWPGPLNQPTPRTDSVSNTGDNPGRYLHPTGSKPKENQ